MDKLPFFEDSGSHILSIANQLQVVLLLVGMMLHIGEMYCLGTYGTSSTCLCDSVAGLCSGFYNSIVS